jgi:hypothetical protein
LEQPADSVFNFIALNHNGAIETKIHPAFEGNFMIVENDHHFFLTNNTTPDPSQKDRKRCYSWSLDDKARLSGSVSWKDSCEHVEKVKKGMISLSSENSNATLWI